MTCPSNGLGELRDLHGRHFNSLNKNYMLPADSVEMKGLNGQHTMLRIALGNLYPENYVEAIVSRLAPRKGETIRICDLGSGSGDWAAEMAAAFPHADVLAIDLAPGLPVNPPANLQNPEYINQFDLIQGRCIGNGVKDYPALFDLVHRYLKPGGIFIAAEGFIDIFGEDLKSMKPGEQGGLARLFSEIARRQPSPNNTGVDRTGYFLDGWLREHKGFEDVKEQKIHVPMGWEGSVELCKEPRRAGELMLQSARSFAGAWRPMFLSMGLPASDVDKWVALAQEELDSPETTRAYAKFLFVCATKRN
ncbi:S-adenosyl-L-methionine-dependent methyltransferase [Rhizoctonia solani]|nr:S-adenosyl-L-methionine-dependent methyltransferase [Rhizoctonia solani]